MYLKGNLPSTATDDSKNSYKFDIIEKYARYLNGPTSNASPTLSASYMSTNLCQKFQGFPISLLILYIKHCVKSVQIRSFFWSLFFRIRTEYKDILRISPYSVQMQENTDQKKLRIWTHFTQWRYVVLYVMLRFYIVLNSF